MSRLGQRGAAAAACIAVALGIASPAFAGESDRVVIAGGDLTEIAFELGAGSRIGAQRFTLGPGGATARRVAALAIPVLLMLVFGVVAAGRVVEAKIAVQAAARETSRALAEA